jgi:hypothetical protein
MNRTKNFRHALGFVIVLSCFLAACSSSTPAGGPQAWIDFPRDGANIPEGSTVTVVSHAYSPDGVSEVLLSVDGTAFSRVAPASPGETLAEVHHEWVAAQPGRHTLQVRAFDSSDAVIGSDSISVNVTGDETATPTEVPIPTDTPTPTEPPATDTPTPTATTVPPPEVSYWVDDDSITEGECTTLHWDVSGATTITINGTAVGATDTWSLCPESTTSYALHAEGAGGTVDREITVSVSPAADIESPPAPAPTVPADGLALTCRETQVLAWTPVSDPSGVVYYVKLERQATPSSWDPSGGWGPVSDKQVEVDVDCGGVYRWAVRAEDGAGNSSVWSAWSGFGIDLP